MLVLIVAIVSTIIVGIYCLIAGYQWKKLMGLVLIPIGFMGNLFTLGLTMLSVTIFSNNAAAGGTFILISSIVISIAIVALAVTIAKFSKTRPVQSQNVGLENAPKKNGQEQ